MSNIALDPPDWSQVPKGLKRPEGKSSREAQKLVEAWCDKVRPLIVKGGRLHHFVNTADHWSQTYPWSAEPSGEATGLTEVARVWTLHSYGYYGFFKPSVAEVLQQIPESLFPDVDYFVVLGPYDVDDLNTTTHYISDGFHVAQTNLYRAVPNHGIRK